MKISKSSWHYQFINYFREYSPDPTDVCMYIRIFLGSCLIFLLIIALGVTASLLILDPILFLILNTTFFSAGTTFAGAVCYFLGAIIGIFKGSEWCWNKWRGPSQHEEIFVSPFVQWVKDKHNKVCTRIEYEEGKNNDKKTNMG